MFRRWNSCTAKEGEGGRGTQKGTSSEDESWPRDVENAAFVRLDCSIANSVADESAFSMISLELKGANAAYFLQQSCGIFRAKNHSMLTKLHGQTSI